MKGLKFDAAGHEETEIVRLLAVPETELKKLLEAQKELIESKRRREDQTEPHQPTTESTSWRRGTPILINTEKGLVDRVARPPAAKEDIFLEQLPIQTRNKVSSSSNNPPIIFSNNNIILRPS